MSASTDRALGMVRLWGWVGIALGSLAIMVGLALIVVDQADHADRYDGMGAFLGVQSGVLGVLLAVAGSLILWWHRRKPLAAAWTAVLCAFLVALVGVLGNLVPFNPLALALTLAIAAGLAAPGIFVVLHPPEPAP